MDKVWATFAVVLLVATAGCVTATMETTVHNDGMIELDGEIEIGPELVSLLEDQLEESEHDTVGELLIADFQEENEADEEWDNLQIDYEELDDGSILLTMSSDPTDPDQIEGIDVNVTEDEATFINDEGFEQDDDFDEENVELTYIVHMPGEVQETNGEQIDDGSVQWTYTDHQGQDNLHATSSVDENGSDGIPGFGIGIVALAVALLTGAAAYRRRQ